MPSKMFISHYNGKHKVNDWKARSTQGDKGKADSYTYCKEKKKMSTCSLHTLNSKGLRDSRICALHFQYLGFHILQR